MPEMTYSEATLLQAQNKRIAELEAEVERLREDADRYRWLRNFMNLAIVNKTLVTHDTLDAAIDAAMLEGK